MRIPIQPDSTRSDRTDTRELDGGVVMAGRASGSMLWGEAFRHVPFADNPALIEAMGSHFDPDPARSVP